MNPKLWSRKISRRMALLQFHELLQFGSTSSLLILQTLLVSDLSGGATGLHSRLTVTSCSRIYRTLYCGDEADPHPHSKRLLQGPETTGPADSGIAPLWTATPRHPGLPPSTSTQDVKAVHDGDHGDAAPVISEHASYQWTPLIRRPSKSVTPREYATSCDTMDEKGALEINTVTKVLLLKTVYYLLSPTRMNFKRHICNRLIKSG